MDGAVMPFLRQFAGIDRSWFDDFSMPRLELRLANHPASSLFHRTTHNVSPLASAGDSDRHRRSDECRSVR